MKPHTNLLNTILASAPANVRLFKNDNGNAELMDGRRIQYGLLPGSGDLIGATQIRGVAVFTSIEAKTPNDVVRPKQKKWAEFVREFGGIAIVCHSVEECWRDHAVKVSLIEKTRFDGLSFGMAVLRHNSEALEHGATL
jgi:hypothetical protein